MNADNHYTIANGPEELKQALLHTLEKANSDPRFAAQSHYILYKLDNQQSLIRMDPSFHISHYDLLGRPATEAVKEVVAAFLREQCGGRGQLEDVSGKEMLERNKASFLMGDTSRGRVILSNNPSTLVHAREQLERAAISTEARERFGFFHPTHPSAEPAANSQLSKGPSISPKQKLSS